MLPGFFVPDLDLIAFLNFYRVLKSARQTGINFEKNFAIHVFQ